MFYPGLIKNTNFHSSRHKKINKLQQKVIYHHLKKKYPLNNLSINKQHHFCKYKKIIAYIKLKKRRKKLPNRSISIKK